VSYLEALELLVQVRLDLLVLLVIFLGPAQLRSRAEQKAIHDRINLRVHVYASALRVWPKRVLYVLSRRRVHLRENHAGDIANAGSIRAFHQRALAVHWVVGTHVVLPALYTPCVVYVIDFPHTLLTRWVPKRATNAIPQ
jgi:hypothetical protein